MSSGSTHAIPDGVASYIATDALSTAYAAVKNDTAVNSVVVCTAATDETIGFVQIPTAETVAGQPVAVKVYGFSLANCSGGWTRGDKLTPTAAGELVTTTTAANKVCAIAEDTVSDNEAGEVRIISPAIRYDSF